MIVAVDRLAVAVEAVVEAVDALEVDRVVEDKVL